MNRWLLAAALALMAGCAHAQTQVQIGVVTATMNPCQAGTFLDGTIVGGAFHCSPAPTGGTIVAGCGLSGAGTTASPLAINVGIKTLPAARAVASGDNCAALRWNSATAGNFPLPAAGSAGFAWPFAFCLTVVGAGAANFTGQPIEGGPASYGKNQNVCLGVNDQTPAAWTVVSWTALATPNAAALP